MGRTDIVICHIGWSLYPLYYMKQKRFIKKKKKQVVVVMMMFDGDACAHYGIINKRVASGAGSTEHPLPEVCRIHRILSRLFREGRGGGDSDGLSQVVNDEYVIGLPLSFRFHVIYN